MYHGKKKRTKNKIWLTIWWTNGTVCDYDFSTVKQRLNFYNKHKDRIKDTSPSLNS